MIKIRSFIQRYYCVADELNGQGMKLSSTVHCSHGFRKCVGEVMHFLCENKRATPSCIDDIIITKLQNHLGRLCEKMTSPDNGNVMNNTIARLRFEVCGSNATHGGMMTLVSSWSPPGKGQLNSIILRDGSRASRVADALRICVHNIREPSISCR